MANGEINEIVVYIHGVSSSLQGGSHDQQYRQFHNSVARGCINKKPWPQKYCGIEWGWNHLLAKKPVSHELLTDAQRVLGGRIMPVIDEQSDWTWNPARAVVNGMRKLMFFGFGDMFYYVSLDGKQAVRTAVAQQICNYIGKLKLVDDDLVSLTIVGHSAGSVVGFDFLFYVFSDKRSANKFVSKNKGASEAMTKLEKRAKEGTLRIRRFVTFGSPIASVAHRCNKVLEILEKGGQLDPADYGLKNIPTGFGANLSTPRWINLWDKDDRSHGLFNRLCMDPKPLIYIPMYRTASPRLTTLIGITMMFILRSSSIGELWADLCKLSLGYLAYVSGWMWYRISISFSFLDDFPKLLSDCLPFCLRKRSSRVYYRARRVAPSPSRCAILCTASASLRRSSLFISRRRRNALPARSCRVPALPPCAAGRSPAPDALPRPRAAPSALWRSSLRSATSRGPT